MERLAQDLRFALRTIRKSPGFAAVVIFTLALGIGANTAIFDLIDTVLLRTLPVRNPHELFFLEAVSKAGTDTSFPADFFESVRDRNRSFEEVSAFDTTRLSARVDGQPDVLWGQCVSGNFFDLLGVQSARGRFLTMADDRLTSPPAAVISHRYWERRFSLADSVLGTTISLKGIPFIVVGVAPDGFLGIEPGWAPDVWIPMADWARLRLSDHDSVAILGRLKPGVAPGQAQAELDALYRAEYGGRDPATPLDVSGSRVSRIALAPAARGLSDLRDEFSRPLAILMAVVLAVLLIACANVANLMLARATTRRREIAVRVAIGASRARLVRQLLTESVLLALAGGGLGFLLAAWGSDALLRLASSSGSTPISLDLRHDVRILVFAAGLSLAIGILFGLIPAQRASKTDVNSVLKYSSVQGGGGRVTGMRRALVVVQVSLSVILLVAAGLLARSLHELFRVDPGFDRDHVLLVRAYPTIVGYRGAVELDLYSRLQTDLQNIPGVRSASLSRFGFLGGRWSRRIVSPGNSGSPSADATSLCYPVSARFFETMGVPVLQGREFGPSDGFGAPRVAIVSAAFARAHFPQGGAVGGRFRFAETVGNEEVEIVGVVRDVKSLSLRDEAAHPAVYIPISQTPENRLGQITVELRTTADAATEAGAIRRQVQALGGDLPVVGVETQSEMAAESLGIERLMSKLAGAFSVLALLLASIGLYGVLSYDIAQRSREIAIRIAVGAKPRDLLRLVLGQAFRLVVPGALLGLVAALAVPRVLTSLLFGVSPADPLTLAATMVVLALVALLACYLPARRAMAGDPLLALRSP